MREYMRFLSYLIMLTNLITAITITILGGFTNLKDREKPNIQKEPYQRQITIDRSFIEKDINVLFVAKDIENNGNGTWYNGTISPQNSTIVNVSGYQQLHANFIIQKQSQDEKQTLGWVINQYTEEETQQTFQYISYCGFGGGGDDIYVCNQDGGRFQKEYACFIVKRIIDDGTTDNVFYLLNKFFNIYNFGDSQFTFNTDWNYNAPYNIRASEMLVNDSNFIGTGGIVYKRIDLPYFISNGLVFNQIEILYMNANGGEIKQDNQYIVVSSEGYGYYFYMNYKNTNTGLEKYVNGRLFGTYADNNGDVQTYLDKGSQWTNYKYKTIMFVEELSGQQQDLLAKFNNLGGYGYETTTNGNVFDLIGLGFKTWVNLFSMQVGTITLSMLIMAPFLIGFIIWLIKLIKRGG